MKRKVFHGDENRRKKRQWSRQKCGHCEQFLGHTQYHEHRRLYFNSTLNQWTTVHDLRQKKCEPEDVPGSSSSESEGKISCHSRLLEFPKKRQTLTKAWFPYVRCDRCEIKVQRSQRSQRQRSLRWNFFPISAVVVGAIAGSWFPCDRYDRCDRLTFFSSAIAAIIWTSNDINAIRLTDDVNKCLLPVKINYFLCPSIQFKFF